MLKERPTRNDAELRQEFSKMQRAQFIIWLAEQDDAAMKEVHEAISEMDEGQGHDWASVREELNKRHNV